jgi:hypothetical protein
MTRDFELQHFYTTRNPKLGIRNLNVNIPFTYFSYCDSELQVHSPDCCDRYSYIVMTRVWFKGCRALREQDSRSHKSAWVEIVVQSFNASFSLHHNRGGFVRLARYGS